MNLSFRSSTTPVPEKPINVILASQSIGRKLLLDKLGIIFRTAVTNLDEESIIDKDPVKMIARRAAAKADELIKNPRVYNVPQEDKALIIAADSMAILGKKTYGKSHEKSVTREMLKELMGKTHTFVTATKIVYLVAGKAEKTWTHVSETKVTMRKMTNPELDLYVNRFDFSRFAAAYSINEMPWDLITKIDGSYTNVIGLPFEVLLPILKSLKIIVDPAIPVPVVPLVAPIKENKEE